MEAVSRTEMPRLHFPPRVLCFNDYLKSQLISDGVTLCVWELLHSDTIRGLAVVIHTVEYG